MKQYQRVRIHAPEGDRKEFHGQYGAVVQSITGGMGGKHAVVEMELSGMRYDFKESELRGAFAIRIKNGVRVRVRRGPHQGETGEVVASFTRSSGEAACMVALDGKGGVSTGFARATLETVKKERKGALPPDPEGRNGERREWAEASLDAFMAVCRTDRGDALPDLLCDLAHLCDETGEDFAGCLRRARMHYRDETGGKGKQSFCIGIDV